VSTFTRKYVQVVRNEVEVIVEGAETEEQAGEIADLYHDMGEGKYRHNPGAFYVTINVTEEDSDFDTEDPTDEWEPDEEDEDDEWADTQERLAAEETDNYQNENETGDTFMPGEERDR